MNISKRKVISLSCEEKVLINKMVNFLYELEEELEGEYDFSSLRDDLEEIRDKEYVFEDENHD